MTLWFLDAVVTGADLLAYLALIAAVIAATVWVSRPRRPRRPRARPTADERWPR